MLRPLLLFGTRPEAIKMAPLVHEVVRRKTEIAPLVCVSGQHQEMLAQVTSHFGIKADIDLGLMRPGQSLADFTSRAVTAIDGVINRYKPDCVIAQGDTNTTLSASLAAFFRKVPFIHVEAGLRTGNLNAPWPEEFNRRAISLATTLHCAPTASAAQTLLEEGFPADNVRETGNTVVDALLWTLKNISSENILKNPQYRNLGDRQLVLITGHRRENFGTGLQNICEALSQLAKEFPDVSFVFPVHLNPQVQEPVKRLLREASNILLLPPVPYNEFIWLAHRAVLILTDSGGVQEEAPTLGKPVLVMREATERPEAVETGSAILVGTSRSLIVSSASKILSGKHRPTQGGSSANPFGDGHTATRIIDWVLERC